MPIYEFTCTKCEKNFEQLCRSAGDLSSVECPACGSGKVKKKFSTFAFSSGRRDSSSQASSSTKSGCASCSGGHCSTCH